MSNHPQTTRFRNLAQESEDGWAISELCDLLDAQHAQTESALAELADGSRPRVVITAEELDALPVGSVIYDGGGEPGFNLFKMSSPSYVSVGGIHFPPNGVVLPATVLHTPTPDPTR